MPGCRIVLIEEVKKNTSRRNFIVYSFHKETSSSCVLEMYATATLHILISIGLTRPKASEIML